MAWTARHGTMPDSRSRDFPALAGPADGILLPAGAPRLAPGTPRSLVFTFRAGKVVRMESLSSRDAAFALPAG